MVVWNARGFPSKKDNRHKIEKAQKIIRGKDVALILETGTNKNNPVRDVLNNYTTTTQNNMKEIEDGKGQY